MEILENPWPSPAFSRLESSKIPPLRVETSRGQVAFDHLQGSTLRMYVCGITPYDFSHIGHGRCYVVFDMIYRYLSFLGYQVKYCRNFTDIDDKLLNKAEKEFGDASRYKEIADRYIAASNWQ